MKYLCLLTTTLCLSSATIIPGLGAGQDNEKLHRRSEPPPSGRPPPDVHIGSGRVYNFQYDGDAYGREQEESDNREHAERMKRERPPSEEFRPRNPDPSVERRERPRAQREGGNGPNGNTYRHSTHRDHTPRKRQEKAATEETKRAIRISLITTTKNPSGRKGHEFKQEKGLQFPSPDPGAALVTNAKVNVKVPLTGPTSRVQVTSSATAALEGSKGPVVGGATYTVTKDLRSAPHVKGKDIEEYKDYKTKGGTRVYFKWRDGRLVMYSASGKTRMPEEDQRAKVYEITKRRRNSMTDTSISTKKRRSNVMDDITTSAATSSDSALSLQTEWQIYHDIYQSLQANATELVAPILNNLTSENNATIVYEMAWSIDSQLLGPPNAFEGAYYHGLTNLDDSMDTWLLQNGFLLDSNGTIYQPYNGTVSNSTMDDAIYMLTVNSLLKELYTETWDAAVQALNVSVPYNNYTILENLVYFASVITATNDTSIVPKSFFEIDVAASDADAAWFLPGLGGNSTNW